MPHKKRASSYLVGWNLSQVFGECLELVVVSLHAVSDGRDLKLKVLNLHGLMYPASNPVCTQSP